MIKTNEFYESLIKNGVEFYTGVPDSLLKDICSYISDSSPPEKHVISANEGGAIGLAIGYHLATKKIPLVYMQNSGLGNTINPLLSLADPKVYGIPMILLIGWRGELGVKDEPQHVKQGEVTEALLKTLSIPYIIISSKTSNVNQVISNVVKEAETIDTPFAILVRKNTFEPYRSSNKILSKFELNREEAIIKSADLLSDTDIIISTTGKASRELFEYRAKNKQGHQRDFLTVGGMGHASQIALGIAIAQPERIIYCFDGDGAALMHTGSLGIIGDINPENLKHIIFNNGAHDSVGGQPTIGFNIDFGNLAKSLNYKKSFKIDKLNEFDDTFKKFQKQKGPCLLEIRVAKGARKDLGRPTISPKENKKNFIRFLNNV